MKPPRQFAVQAALEADHSIHNGTVSTERLKRAERLHSARIANNSSETHLQKE